MRAARAAFGLAFAVIFLTLGVVFTALCVEGWHHRHHFADQVGACLGFGVADVICLLLAAFGLGVMVNKDFPQGEAL